MAFKENIVLLHYFCALAIYYNFFLFLTVPFQENKAFIICF